MKFIRQIGHKSRIPNSTTKGSHVLSIGIPVEIAKNMEKNQMGWTTWITDEGILLKPTPLDEPPKSDLPDWAQ